MNTFMAIMSQLFWGVTIGALSATASALAKGVLALGCLGGAGWYAVRGRRRKRTEKPD